MVFTFSKSAYRVTIDAYGPYYCPSTDRGKIELFANNQLVETVQAPEPDWADCATGNDDIAGDRLFVPSYTGPVDSVRIYRALPDSMPNGGQTFSSYTAFLSESPDSSYCPPTNDAVINDAQMIASFKAAVQQAHVGGDHEEAAGIYYDPQTASFRFVSIQGPPPGQCETGELKVPPTNNGAKLYALFHVHPKFPLTDETCSVGGREVYGRYDPDFYGGGSPQDWKDVEAFSQRLGYDLRSYTIDYSGKIWRLYPHLNWAQRRRNPNHWRDRGDACFN